MKHWFIVLGFIFVIHSPIVYSHGSSHYICNSEQIDNDRIEHCTSYDNPLPDKIYRDWYTQEQIQQRETENTEATLVVVGVLLLFIFIVVGIIG